MATGAPPDGWNMTGTTAWGTGNGNYALGSGGFGSGGISLTTGTIVSDFIPVDSSGTVSYVASIRVLMLTASNYATVNFVTYQADKSTAVSTVQLLNSTLAGTYGSGQSDISKVFTPSSSPAAAWGRWEITGSGYQIKLFFALIDRLRPSLTLNGSTVSANIASGTWTALPWATNFSNESNLYNSTTMNLRKAGNYLFTVNMQYAPSSGSFAAGNIIQTRVAMWNGSTSTAVSPAVYHYVAATGETAPEVNFSQVVYVANNALSANLFTSGYQIQVMHNSTTTLKTVPANCSCGLVLLN